MVTAPRDEMMRLRRCYGATARELQRSSRGLAAGVAAIGAHVLAGLAAALAVVWLWRRSWIAGALVYPLTLAWIGSRMRALGNMIHECSHRTLVRGARANRVIGHALCFVLLDDLVAYAAEHRSHHLYLGDPVRDRDLSSRRALFERLGAFGTGYVRAALALRHLRDYLRPVWTPARVATIACVAWSTGWGFAALFVVPYATTYQMLRFFSDAADHAGLLDAADELDRSRNHAHRHRLVNWLLFPRNDQYHLVHHLFPAVATQHLPRLHAALLGDPAYAARSHSLEAPR